MDKRWNGLTISKDLGVGLYFAGSFHRSFTLRVAMAGDLITAQEKHPQGPMQLVTLEVYRQQLLAVGDIPAESLTTQLLRESLTEGDLALIAEADEELEKKLATPSAASAPGDASSTPLPESATT